MILINNFSIDNNELHVTVTTSVGETITSALVWTHNTFKDYAQAVDVSSLLSGASNMEAFSIPANMIGESNLDGIYFIEFTSTDESDETPCTACDNPLGVAANLLCYKECLLNKIKEYSACKSSCCDPIVCEIINIDVTLKGLIIALEFGYYSEAIISLKALKKLCRKSECSPCLDCPDLHTPKFRSGLNYGTLDGTLILI